jgi:hypothetical protein
MRMGPHIANILSPGVAPLLPHPARKGAPTSPRTRGEVLPHPAPRVRKSNCRAQAEAAFPLPSPPPQAGEGARGALP